nr:NAD(P)H-dependent oxidoreductase [Kibdelosporangium sp. MJ126-NF4]CEL19104.1 NAD(P)H oxidoreductase YRKL @ Putative NADPH-quinone reductase (modulator of drug activity B) @ Flavodoxin 2 [Kibdelosporangium sp. MJ126-NF4]CTQ95094.1 NAD(P)H oxidoreductase YRKL (EC 1.6.99.-) @ Putative NADPH-quinone reductase (modulator of drug activity B) @ Flavodoxin 2 [Kibdelosporangium sp. MJ126-NF4]
MNVLWVLAHPEARSLNGSLHREGVAALTEAGHAVEVSDLYAMKWNPVVDRDDYGIDDERLRVPHASKQAYDSRTLSQDVRAEQAKLDRADLLVMQFPLWWFGVPAILKGWIDRVFVRGYAYGIPDPDRPGGSLRYGTGGLAGKRALAVVTLGTRPEGHQPRGLEGELNDVLFPLLHGTFFYTGMQPLPPVTIYSADRLSEQGYAEVAAELRTRLADAETAAPIPYRTQHGGDYDENFVLLPHIAPTRTGLDAHLTS